METQFQQVDFGPLKQFLDNDDVTDISYSNGGQVWIKTLSKGVYRVENTGIDNTLVEKIAFQCANTMGKSFNMANPFLDAESAELRLNFVHDSIARNGIALLVRKTPAKPVSKIKQSPAIRVWTIYRPEPTHSPPTSWTGKTKFWNLNRSLFK